MKGISMPKSVVYVLAGLLIVTIGAQIVPVDRTNPPVESDVVAPDAVRQVLKQSCYDCHSNETVWPWYSKIAPVSWLVAHDVKEAREEINFSIWNRYSKRQQSRKMREMLEQIDKGEMPLPNYVWQHPKARLTAEDKTILRDWVQSAAPEAGPEAGENYPDED
jgi:uncharacterized membrane protein